MEVGERRFEGFTMRGHIKLFVLQMDQDKAQQFKAARAGAGAVGDSLQDLVLQARKGFTPGRI